MGETKKRERDRRPKKVAMKNEQSGTDHKPNRQVVEIGGTGEPPTPSLRVMIPWKTDGVGANMVRDRAKGPWTWGSQEGVAEEERQEEPVRVQTSESICLVGGGTLDEGEGISPHSQHSGDPECARKWR